MRFYIDTDLIVAFVTADVPTSGRVLQYALRAGVTTVASELSRMEGHALALKTRDPVLRADFDGFLGTSEILALTRPVFELAAEIEVRIRCSQANAIHLAAATIHQCDEFVTDKKRLARWKGIRVHVL